MDETRVSKAINKDRVTRTEFILATSCLVGDEGLVFKARHGRAKGVASTWMGKGLGAQMLPVRIWCHTRGAGERKESSGAPESGRSKPSAVQPGAAKPGVCVSLPS